MPEIAHCCHQKRVTVHLHLQIRECHEPGTRARHETALAAKDPDRPTTGWHRRLKEALDFLAVHGQIPHRDPNTQAERSLHTWIAQQRRTYRRGQLSTPKIILLGDLPGWAAVTRQRDLDQHWQTRLTLLREYIATTGTQPRYAAYESVQEHTLGVWLLVQHRNRSRKKLQAWRLEALDSAIPGWRSRMCKLSTMATI